MPVFHFSFFIFSLKEWCPRSTRETGLPAKAVNPVHNSFAFGSPHSFLVLCNNFNVLMNKPKRMPERLFKKKYLYFYKLNS